MSDEPGGEFTPEENAKRDLEAEWVDRHPNPSGLAPGAGPAETPRPQAAWTEADHYDPGPAASAGETEPPAEFGHTGSGEEVPPLL